MRCLRRLKELVVGQLVSAASIRGALFIFLALQCRQQLRLHADPRTYALALIPGLLMLVFNALVIIDALKAVVWWLPARKRGTRAMRQEATTVPLTPADAAGGFGRGVDDSPAPNRGRGRARKPKAKVRAVPDEVTGEGASDDDELVFRGDDGPDRRGDVSPEEGEISAEAELHPRADGLLFGRRGQTGPSSSAAAPHAPNIPRNGSTHAPRAESAVLPPSWKARAEGDEDHFSDVSVPVTPLERQLRTANMERERRATLERQEARARAEALKEADRCRQEKSAKRPRGTEGGGARHSRRPRDQTDAQPPPPPPVKPAEVKPGVAEAPPMVDHDVVLQTGSIPRCASPQLQPNRPCAPRLTPPPPPAAAAPPPVPPVPPPPPPPPPPPSHHLHVCRGTHYEMLGVARDADDGELKKAFHRLAQKWHPDKNPEHIAEAETVFKAVKLSYDVLADATKRRKYDAKLQMGAHLKAAYA